ncbi:MAG TPA: hypothetical protein VFO41_08865, partial [Alphaproteobacteria bacterium]|nr:hypothetical protein [Alphaproteobacteria bacterium]
YRYPKEGYPAVVTELIDPPYIDPNVGESRPECMLKHDVRIAMLTESCHLIELVYCGAYLEPYTGEIEPGSGSGTSG